MSVDLRRYEKLKSEVDKLQRDANRAEGALTQLMEKLSEEFDCDTIEDAEELADELKLAAEKAERKFDEALSEFEDEYSEVLERK